MLPLQWARARSLMRELRSHKPHARPKRKKETVNKIKDRITPMHTDWKRRHQYMGKQVEEQNT